MKLEQFIERHFEGNQSWFARHMDVERQAVTKWINGGWIVVGGRLYSPKREVQKKIAK
ncbi:hypothetical protein [Vibrio variabilis]|uniref:hypothetical protein n=1 Tax=Vibrio variabilis TaxID=990271 RepID=UPI001EFA1D90|nr:hypothetical protein [Vibrio variabilis]